MKKLLFLAIGMWFFAIGCVSAQSLEQKRICALKWTLQQTFYNKAEGQQLAKMDVTEFKSFDEFKKNELVSKLMKKVSDKTDLKRVNSILNAKNEDELSSSVPSGGKKEYQADVEKMKSQAPAAQEETEEETPAVEEVVEDTATTASVTPIKDEENNNEEAETENDATAEEDEEATATEGIGLWGVVLISSLVYVILTTCLLLFKRSRSVGRSGGDDQGVSLEQYRSERLRLIERIKAIEIELESKKDNNSKSVKEQPQPAVQQPVAKEKEVVAPVPTPKKEPAKVNVEQTLFSSPTKDEAPSAEVTPIITPTETPSSIKPRHTTSIMFFPVPVDGVFSNGTEEIEVGKSLYMLKTTDGQNATFTILNTPEAIATALISLSQMVKPVCKIINTVTNPLEIVTEGPGTAVREGDTWKMVTKSVVRLI